MSLTTLPVTAATIIFTSFAVIVVVCMVIDTLRYVAENFTDEVREIPVERRQKRPLDEFDLLYINVAYGDRRDRAYWLRSVKGGVDCDKS